MPEELTPKERTVVWQHRLLTVMWELKFGISAASLMTKLLELANHDTALIAQANSVHWAINGLIQLWGTPLAGALSDAMGRKRIWAMGRISKMFWFLGSMRATSMSQYIMACIMAWGIFDFGTLSIEDAAWADIFGSRPELSSRLRSDVKVLSQISGLVGPMVGAEVLRRLGAVAGFKIAAGLCVLEAAMVLSTHETLPPEERKPMPSLRSLGNPFASIGVLFTHGPGLRGLGIAAGLMRTVVTIYSTIEPFRLGPLGWSPAEQSYYSGVLSGCNSMTTALVAKPMLKAFGNRKVFEWGSTAAAFAYFGMSQSCRPAGASHQLRRTVQFMLCKLVLMTPWSEPAFSAAGPMIIKQGSAVTDCGRGTLTAAYDGLASAIGVVSPIMWASLYTFFQAGQDAEGIRWVVACLSLLVGCVRLLLRHFLHRLQLVVRTGAGGDNGIDHTKNWLRVPYDSTFLRSHYLHPHP
jgi:MFS family permease